MIYVRKNVLKLPIGSYRQHGIQKLRDILLPVPCLVDQNALARNTNTIEIRIRRSHILALFLYFFYCDITISKSLWGAIRITRLALSQALLPLPVFVVFTWLATTDTTPCKIR